MEICLWFQCLVFKTLCHVLCWLECLFLVSLFHFWKYIDFCPSVCVCARAHACVRVHNMLMSGYIVLCNWICLCCGYSVHVYMRSHMCCVSKYISCFCLLVGFKKFKLMFFPTLGNVHKIFINAYGQFYKFYCLLWCFYFFILLFLYLEKCF